MLTEQTVERLRTLRLGAIADAYLAQQRDTNAKLKQRNDALDADVRDLKQGLEAVEERARLELGMIRKDEIFYQVAEPRR